MITNTINASISPILLQNSKVLALETSLQETLYNYKELIIQLDQFHIECENYKTQLLTQNEKCKSKTCDGAEELKKVIQRKNNVIQSAASALTRLSESRNWSIIEELFTILLEDSERTPTKTTEVASINKLITPKKELDTANRDESISEIEGTPTGRHSPIIQMKKPKTNLVMPVEREKKKCPDSWFTSDTKQLKLKYPINKNKKDISTNNLRQSRLNIVKVKTSNIIDLSCSPEFSGGSRNNKSFKPATIKNEVIDNDDTILPSPTSGPTTDFTLFKSPMKCRKPQLRLKPKTETSNRLIKKYDEDGENKIKMEIKDVQQAELIEDDLKDCNSRTFTQNDSINILHPDRISKKPKSPLEQNEKMDNCQTKSTNVTTFCQTQSSESLLNHFSRVHEQGNISPSKVPLAENINTINMAEDKELQASMLLPPYESKQPPANDTVKRRLMQPLEIHHGPTPTTKAQKRQLPGWACEKCISFFSELHKDDPELMWKKINECSHHRGINNPERPKTPPGYWNPRWKVPDDTEEFNRRNNV